MLFGRYEGIDRLFIVLGFRVIGIRTQTFRHFTAVSVLESKGARRQPVYEVQSTLIRHPSSTPHAPPAQRRIPENGRCLFLLCPKKLKADGLNNKVVITTCVFDAKLTPATCLCAVQFLLIPWIMPY